MLQKEQFIEFMIKSRALQFGDFTTKSGRKTPYFINTGNYTTGSQMQRLGEFYAAAVEENFGDSVDNLFGPAYKGIPIGVSAAISLFRDYGRSVTVTFDRKEVKDHGEGGWLMGHQYGGGQEDRIVIVEDVTTAGTSIRQNLPGILQIPNTRVLGLVVSVDRMEKGRSEKSALQEVREEFGIKTVSLINFMDIVEFLKSEKAVGLFPSDLADKMMEYWGEYGIGQTPL